MVIILKAPKQGSATNGFALSPGEYRVLDMTVRDKDDDAYLLIEDGKEVILVNVPRDGVGSGKTPSVLKIEEEKLIPKKFSLRQQRPAVGIIRLLAFLFPAIIDI